MAHRRRSSNSTSSNNKRERKIRRQVRALEEELEHIEDRRFAELHEIEMETKRRKEEIRLEEERLFLEEELRISTQIQDMIAVLEELSLTNDMLRSQAEMLLPLLEQEERTALQLQESSRLYSEKIGQAKACTQDMEASFAELTSLLPHFYDSVVALEEEVHFYQECSQAEYRSKVMYNEITSNILERLNSSLNSTSSSEDTCVLAEVIETVPKCLIKSRHMMAMPRTV